MASASRRFKRKKKRESRSILRQLIYGAVSITLVCALGYGVWYITRLPFFTIQNIAVMGGETVSHNEIESRVERALVGNYFFLVPKRFVYFYPEEDIEHALADVPRVRNFSVETSGRNTLNISFEEYVPYALWCNDITATVCTFLSRDGYSFEEAPPLRGGALLRFIQEGVTPEAGREAYSASEIEKTRTLSDGFARELGLRVHAVVRTTASDEIFHLSSGGRLLVAPDASAEQTLSNLRSVLQSEEFKDIADGSFDYIDLRFGNRVFVQEHEPEEEETATTSEEEESEDL